MSVDRLTQMFMGIVFTRLLLRTPAQPDDARAFVELVLTGAAPDRPAPAAPTSTVGRPRSSAREKARASAARKRL